MGFCVQSSCSYVDIVVHWRHWFFIRIICLFSFVGLFASSSNGEIVRSCGALVNEYCYWGFAKKRQHATHADMEIIDRSEFNWPLESCRRITHWHWLHEKHTNTHLHRGNTPCLISLVTPLAFNRTWFLGFAHKCSLNAKRLTDDYSTENRLIE